MCSGVLDAVDPPFASPVRARDGRGAARKATTVPGVAGNRRAPAVGRPIPARVPAAGGTCACDAQRRDCRSDERGRASDGAAAAAPVVDDGRVIVRAASDRPQDGCRR
jgi:hypothetical protein